jgi:hypothetical protein
MLSHGGAGGGRVRTAEEFRRLLEASGLTLTALIPTASSLNVIEARPARRNPGDPPSKSRAMTY